MTRSKKAWLGVLTLFPLAGIVLYFFAIMGVIMLSSQTPSNDVSEGFLAGMGFAIFILFASVAVTLGLTIYYLIHIINNKNLDQTKSEHVLWIMLILLVGMIGQIAYWYAKIWKEDPPHGENTDILDIV